MDGNNIINYLKILLQILSLEKRGFEDVNKIVEDYDSSGANFKVTPDDRRLYGSWFDQLKPEEGRLSWDKVRTFMMQYKLPESILDKTWELADQDGDGSLDRYEFIATCHLTSVAYMGEMIPDQVIIHSYFSYENEK